MKKNIFLGLAFLSCLYSRGQIIENFDSYLTGEYITNVSEIIQTKSGLIGGVEDAMVTDEIAFSGDHSLYLSSIIEAGGPQNLVITPDFGGLITESGTFVFESKLWIEENKGAHFSFRGLEIPMLGIQTTMDLYMLSNGTLRIDDGGDTGFSGEAGVDDVAPLIETTFPFEEWFTVAIHADITSNHWELFINGISQGDYTSSNNLISYVNIFPENPTPYGGNGQSGFYMDDVSYEYTDSELLSKDGTILSIGQTQGLVGTEITPSVTIRNVGVDLITSFDISVLYDGETITKSVTLPGLPSLADIEVDMDDFVTLTMGESVITATISNINGEGEDEDTSNDSKSLTLNPGTAANGKAVFIEGITGTWCGGCPGLHVTIDKLADKYPDLFFESYVHGYDPMEYTPYLDGIVTIGGGAAFPKAYVDRQSAIDPDEIENNFLDQVIISPKAVLSIGADYTDGESSATVFINADFLASVSGDYRLALVVTEKGVTGTTSGYDQANYFSGELEEMGGYEDLPNPVPASEMIYNHVARSILPSFEGAEESLPEDITDGEEYLWSIELTLDPDWDLNELNLIAILINSDGKVDNAYSVSFNEAIENDFSSIVEEELAVNSTTVYPNPTTGICNINLTNLDNESVKVEVYNVNGTLVANKDYGVVNGNVNLPLEINSKFERGIYFIKIFKGQTIEMTRIVLE